jgi:DMSO/TMAO reductase YedYZ heme-binding membrane subunit
MNMWETIAWMVARAGGFTAYVLLTLAVALGLALSLRWQSTRWPRLITNDLHRFLTLLSLAFVAVHGLAVWLDPFMRFGWTEVLVPFMSHYRPLWMALGIVAGYLALAVWLSTELRPRIGYAWWRRLHSLAFAVYALATAHGLATGSDTRTSWALGLYAGSALLVGSLLGVRLLTPVGTQSRAEASAASGVPRPQGGTRGRTYPKLAGLVALLLLGGVLWTATGPAQPGWNAIANNGQGSGARGVQAATGQTTSSVFAVPFTANVQGTLTQSQPNATGGVTLRVDTTLSGGAAGAFQVLLQGQPANDGSVAVTAGRVTLAGPGGSPRYQGALQGLQTDGADVRLRAVLQGPGGRAAPWPEATRGRPPRGLRPREPAGLEAGPRSGLVLQGTLQLTPDGRVGGLVRVTSD